MEEAERIAREEHGSVKLAVISGVWLPRSALVLALGLTVGHRGRNARLLPQTRIRARRAVHEQILVVILSCPVLCITWSSVVLHATYCIHKPAWEQRSS